MMEYSFDQSCFVCLSIYSAGIHRQHNRCPDGPSAVYIHPQYEISDFAEIAIPRLWAIIGRRGD
jgi:hypothetical protein